MKISSCDRRNRAVWPLKFLQQAIILSFSVRDSSFRRFVVSSFRRFAVSPLRFVCSVRRFGQEKVTGRRGRASLA
jgi:hypothetical protein